MSKLFLVEDGFARRPKLAAVVMDDDERCCMDAVMDSVYEVIGNAMKACPEIFKDEDDLAERVAFLLNFHRERRRQIQGANHQRRGAVVAQEAADG